jgi:flagellin-like protein
MRRATKDKNNIYTKLLKDKKGISPVITTVILVAVGIALAVAIGLWMSGLVATFTRFEKLEVTSQYAVLNSSITGGGWSAYVTLKNTGSADATISSILVNGIPVTSSSTGVSVVTGIPPISLPVGNEIRFLIEIKKDTSWGSGKLSAGTTVNIVFHSAAGKDYPASVTLP